MKKYIIILISLIPLLFMSCNPDGIGIFYKISVEPALSTSSLSEKSIYKIVELSGVKYVLAGGTVYKENGSDWDAIAEPSGEIQAVSLATTNTKVYSIYADDTNSSMYELSGSSWIQAAGTSSIANSNDLTLISINNSTTALFINKEVGLGDFNIYSYDGTTLSDITGGNTITMPIVSAAYDGTTDYYIVSSNTTNQNNGVIYTTSSLTSAVSSVTLTGLSAGLGSILYYSTNTSLYTSGKDGILYVSDETGGPSALTWTAVNATAMDNERLGDMTIVDIGGTNYLLIASNGGFYEMNLTSGAPVSPTSVTIGSTVYESVDLYTEIVFSIFSSASDSFYIGSSNGLWYSDTNELTIK